MGVQRIRVLIVDDALAVCHLLADALSANVGLEVAGIAFDGSQAVEKFRELRPDIVLLDVDMPVMNGLDALTAIRKIDRRAPVLMFSALTKEAAAVTIDALLRGATTYIPKPSFADRAAAKQSLIKELIPTIYAVCSGSRCLPHSHRTDRGPAVIPPAKPLDSKKKARVELVVIGCSTGGPEALAQVLPQLPPDFPVPILIVQHIPITFVRSLAERLSRRSALPVQVAQAGIEIQKSHVWIGEEGWHVVIRRKWGRNYMEADTGPLQNGFRPSVDVLFRSAAETYGASTLGVVLTGMGEDGLRGSEAITHAGGEVLAQDEGSSAVWGMPGSVARAGLAREIVSLNRMALHILQHTAEGRAWGGAGAETESSRTNPKVMAKQSDGEK
jgi:two-component system chemotaxis response regulator CheB